jgi:hypothetical protein
LPDAAAAAAAADEVGSATAAWADALVVASAELAAASELEVDVVLAEEAILGAAEGEG